MHSDFFHWKITSSVCSLQKIILHTSFEVVDYFCCKFEHLSYTLWVPQDSLSILIMNNLFNRKMWQYIFSLTCKLEWTTMWGSLMHTTPLFLAIPLILPSSHSQVYSYHPLMNCCWWICKKKRKNVFLHDHIQQVDRDPCLSVPSSAMVSWTYGGECFL